MDRRMMPHTQRIIEHEIARSRGKRHVDSERPRQRVAITNQQALLGVDPRRILTGEVEVYDDREPRQR
jgi:hypothetical protein